MRTKSIKPLYNPYQDASGARQLSETIPHFLSRLPPSTSDWEPGFEWIWVANPYHPPPDTEPALAQFRHAAEERLGLFAEFEKMATLTAGRNAGITAQALTALRQDIAKERRETVSDLRELADACNVVTGKWMLFPPPGEVDAVWARVAAATAEGELGTAAKVETRGRAEKERLVCVYTRDCREKEDVARVLIQMRELGLVRPGGKQIYYKSGELSTVVFGSFAMRRGSGSLPPFRCLDGAWNIRREQMGHRSVDGKLYKDPPFPPSPHLANNGNSIRPMRYSDIPSCSSLAARDDCDWAPSSRNGMHIRCQRTT